MQYRNINNDNQSLLSTDYYINDFLQYNNIPIQLFIDILSMIIYYA